MVKLSVSSTLLLLICITVYTQQVTPAEQPKNPSVHYRPQGQGFVTMNGSRRFNRALYGTHTAFRIEAGDLPEFGLYLPGMGGNCRLGIIAGRQSKWLIKATFIKAVYLPGAMLYEIKDALLGTGTLYITARAAADREAMLLQVTGTGITTPAQLVVAFGGASGKKFSRDGDIGADPESSFYLQPAYCSNNVFAIRDNNFTLCFGANRSFNEAEKQALAAGDTSLVAATKAKILQGVWPTAMKLLVADANKQQSPATLVASTADSLPVLTGQCTLKNKDTLSFLLQTTAEGATPVTYAQLPLLVKAAEAARKQLAGRIQVRTPDAYINTLGGALSVAADGIWESPTYLHGAVAWRMRLPAWRGAYVADVLGWHDRAHSHFSSYALSQVTSPAAGPVVADTALHGARQLEKMGTAMFSSGYICRNPNGDLRPHHYDMNLVFIDQLFNHFYWTGDTAYMKEMWPVIQRHLAWEKRNFDADNDGLYDAYCCIWASDALQYSGGGVTHSSAYNYRSNKMAALLATIIGENPQPYQQEAQKIGRALQSRLWMPLKGSYAEYKDALGLQLQHPAAGLWTIYHALDAGVPDAFQAYQLLRYVDTDIPHIPIKAAGWTGDKLYLLSTTTWQPYTWSVNNVALAENLHTSLAYWQGNRCEDAYRLWKSALVESMYMSAAPGNFAQLSYYDAMRGELYRDFADPIGMAARSLVEGLFGVLPDALHDTLTIRPGWPAAWPEAALQTPDIQLDFKRAGNIDQYTIVPAFAHTMSLRLQLRAWKDGVPSIQVNGQPVNYKALTDAVGTPLLQVTVAAAAKYSIRITWKGLPVTGITCDSLYVAGQSILIGASNVTLQKLYDPQQVLVNGKITGNRLQATINASYGNKTFFVQVQRGALAWWQPVNIVVTEPVVIIPDARQDSTAIRFLIKNYGAALQGTIVINPGFREFRIPLPLAAKATSPVVEVSVAYLLPGNNLVRFEWEGHATQINMLQWNVKAVGIAFEKINLYNIFNNKVTNIFDTVYTSPRPASPTLQLPVQGIGNWCYPLATTVIDDSGLRQLAADKNEIDLPQYIPFYTPGDTNSNNIVFTSRWDRYPDSIAVPLSGYASHVYLLMAGTTNPMQSRLENGRILVVYTDGTADTLSLVNPQNWWPIEQDYFQDGLAFTTGAATPLRLYLKTGALLQGLNKYTAIKGFSNRAIDGGAATVLNMPLNPNKELQSLRLETIANDVVIGLMGVTLVRNR